MITSLSCLILEETFWHRIWLYKLDEPTDKKSQAPRGDSNQPSSGADAGGK